MKAILDYLKKKNKTGLGFNDQEVHKFYEKVGFNTKKGLGKRFFYDYGDSKTNKEEQSEYVVYLEGKDKFMTKVLKTKSTINLPGMHW